MVAINLVLATSALIFSRVVQIFNQKLNVDALSWSYGVLDAHFNVARNVMTRAGFIQASSHPLIQPALPPVPQQTDLIIYDPNTLALDLYYKQTPWAGRHEYFAKYNTQDSDAVDALARFLPGPTDLILYKPSQELELYFGVTPWATREDYLLEYDDEDTSENDSGTFSTEALEICPITTDLIVFEAPPNSIETDRAADLFDIVLCLVAWFSSFDVPIKHHLAIYNHVTSFVVSALYCLDSARSFLATNLGASTLLLGIWLKSISSAMPLLDDIMTVRSIYGDFLIDAKRNCNQLCSVLPGSLYGRTYCLWTLSTPYCILLLSLLGYMLSQIRPFMPVHVWSLGSLSFYKDSHMVPEHIYYRRNELLAARGLAPRHSNLATSSATKTHKIKYSTTSSRARKLKSGQCRKLSIKSQPSKT